MSPYIISPESIRAPSLEMADFDITENGFLPHQAPLARLPNAYYQQWEEIASALPQLIQSRQIRTEVDQLPVLSTAKLHTKEEWRRAYVVLAFITHAYIWGDDKPSEILPPAIAIPFAKVSQHLELPPVATYAALCLWNYQPASDTIDFTDADSLRMLNNMTGTEDEAWFYLISVMVEAQGAPAIPLMLDAIRAGAAHDLAAVIEALHELRAVIDRLGRLLERMYERCRPGTFYHEIRPLLAGSKNMGAAGLPRGVYYDYGAAGGEWVQLRGGSNAQSSLIQFFDAALGVVHESTGGPSPQGGVPREQPFHQEMRSYMPGPHHRFLDRVIEMANLRELAHAESSHSLQPALLEAYQAAISALSDFRGIHMQIVARYIIIPSRQASVPGRLNLAVASHTDSEDKEGKKFTGTGGTDLVPFLKQTRAETDRAGEAR